MRLAIVVVVLTGTWMGSAASSCTHPEQGTTITPVADPGAEAGAPSSPSTSSTGSTDASSPTAMVLPPLDAACTGDADCDYVAVSLTGPFTCCASCGTTIGTKSWVAEVTATCARSLVALSNRCPPLACPLGATDARCDAGRCVPKW